MSAAHRCVLTINKGVIVLAIRVVVGKGDFDVGILQVDDRVDRLAIEFVF